MAGGLGNSCLCPMSGIRGGRGTALCEGHVRTICPALNWANTSHWTMAGLGDWRAGGLEVLLLEGWGTLFISPQQSRSGLEGRSPNICTIVFPEDFFLQMFSQTANFAILNWGFMYR